MPRKRLVHYKPHAGLGILGDVDDKTAVTAAITKVLVKHNSGPGHGARLYDAIISLPCAPAYLQKAWIMQGRCSKKNTARGLYIHCTTKRIVNLYVDSRFSLA